MAEQKRRVSTSLELKAHVIALTHPSKKARNYILSELTEEDFGTEEGLEIKKRIDALFRTHGEVGSLSDIQEDVAISDEARQFITSIPKSGVNKAKRQSRKNIKRLVRNLHEWRKKRILTQGILDLTAIGANVNNDKKSSDRTNIDEARDRLEQLLLELQIDRHKKVTHLGNRKKDKIVKWIDDLTKERPDIFVPTGLQHLDEHIGGLQRGDLVMLSAPRGGGKTAMLLQMALKQFDMGFNVAVASLEMQEEQLYARAISNISDVPFSRVRNRATNTQEKKNIKEKWIKFETGIDPENEKTEKRINRFSLFDIKDVNYTPNNLDLEIGPGNYDVIFVDYLSLFGMSRHRDMWTAQMEYSRQLKQIAGRRNCVVVVLTQLSKEERIKYGTAAEENADFWFWWRYGDEEAETGETQLQIGKARNSRRGIIPIRFRLSRMQVDTVGAAAASMSNYKDSPARNKTEGAPEFAYDESEDVFAGLDEMLEKEESEDADDETRDKKPVKKKRKSTKKAPSKKKKTAKKKAVVDDEKKPKKAASKKTGKKKKKRKYSADDEFADVAV